MADPARGRVTDARRKPSPSYDDGLNRVFVHPKKLVEMLRDSKSGRGLCRHLYEVELSGALKIILREGCAIVNHLQRLSADLGCDLIDGLQWLHRLGTVYLHCIDLYLPEVFVLSSSLHRSYVHTSHTSLCNLRIIYPKYYSTRLALCKLDTGGVPHDCPNMAISAIKRIS